VFVAGAVKMAKQFLYRPAEALRIPGGLRLPDFKTIGT
jgi:hypothetical protein